MTHQQELATLPIRSGSGSAQVLPRRHRWAASRIPQQMSAKAISGEWTGGSCRHDDETRVSIGWESFLDTISEGVCSFCLAVQSKSVSHTRHDLPHHSDMLQPIN